MLKERRNKTMRKAIRRMCHGDYFPCEKHTTTGKEDRGDIAFERTYSCKVAYLQGKKHSRFQIVNEELWCGICDERTCDGKVCQEERQRKEDEIQERMMNAN